MEAFSRIGTKSGKNKTYGLKWKSPKNVGTKSGFSPIEIVAHIGQTTEGFITFNFYLFYTWLKLLGKL